MLLPILNLQQPQSDHLNQVRLMCIHTWPVMGRKTTKHTKSLILYSTSFFSYNDDYYQGIQVKLITLH